MPVQNETELELNSEQEEEALTLYKRALISGADQDTFHHINLGRQVATRRANGDPIVTNILDQAVTKMNKVFGTWIDSTSLTYDEMVALWHEARSWKLMVDQLMTIERMGDQLDKQLGFDDPDWEGNDDE